MIRFEKHAVRLEQRREQVASGKLEAVSSLDLWRTGGLGQIAELQRRLSIPISVVILGVLAVPMARTSPRGGRYAKLFLAVVVYFLYNNALGIAHKLVGRGDLPAAIGVWPVHLLLAAIALALVFQQYSGRWRLRLRWRRRWIQFCE